VYFGDCAGDDAAEPAELKTLQRWAAELGIEPGSDDAESGGVGRATGRATDSIDAFGLMRALGLLGIATDTRLAAALAMSSEMVRAAVQALPSGHVSSSARGLQLTAEGKGWLRAQLDIERSGVAADEANRVYCEFAEADAAFKHIVTAWQVRTVDGRDVINDH